MIGDHDALIGRPSSIAAEGRPVKSAADRLPGLISPEPSVAVGTEAIATEAVAIATEAVAISTVAVAIVGTVAIAISIVGIAISIVGTVAIAISIVGRSRGTRRRHR
jgi:hypothetical protein